MVLILSGCRFQEVLSSILAHVGELGWTNCVWGDENLATKKLYPNFQFTAKGTVWQNRLRTTVTVTTICFFIIAQCHVVT